MLLHYKKVAVLTYEDDIPANPRGLPGDTTALQSAIFRDGQRSPITVTQPNEKGLHIVTRGHRRKAAIDALRTQARKDVRDLAAHLESLADSTSSDHHDSVVQEVQRQWNVAKANVERWSYYDVTVSGIDPSDIVHILNDMDADIISKAVDPVSLGETIAYRMEHLGWTLYACCESLDLTESKATACIRAADNNLTAASVQQALRTFEMSLSQFIKKISVLDVQTQQKVMEAAKTRTEQSKRGHGVINARAINKAIADLSGDIELPHAPDGDVLPLLNVAKENIYLALNIQNQWSASTVESAMWHLEEMLLIIRNALHEQGVHDERIGQDI